MIHPLASTTHESWELASVSPINIMVVDDDHSWRDFVAATLCKEQSLALVGEASGLEAIQMVTTLQPSMVVLELNLRDANGLEVGQGILDIAPHTKLIYLSSESDYDVVQMAFRLGASAFVVKSDAVSDLIAAIHAAARNEVFVSTQLMGYGFTDSSA